MWYEVEKVGDGRYVFDLLMKAFLKARKLICFAFLFQVSEDDKSLRL